MKNTSLPEGWVDELRERIAAAAVPPPGTGRALSGEERRRVSMIRQNLYQPALQQMLRSAREAAPTLTEDEALLWIYQRLTGVNPPPPLRLAGPPVRGSVAEVIERSRS